MKPLVAIVTCQKLAARAQACRETWIQDHNNQFDIKFFVGGPSYQCNADTVILSVDDGYRGLPAKTKAVSQYALEHGYDHVFKCDDDTYVQLDRLYASDFANLGDYIGRKRGPSGGYRAPYASGFSYWLNRRAMKIIAAAELTDDPAEDRWVGNTLLSAGIQCSADYRYAVTSSQRNAVSGTEGPRKGNVVISACEFEPIMMKQVHNEFYNVISTRVAGQRSLSEGSKALCQVAIMVKTFMRDGYLLSCVRGIQSFLPESKIVIVDDGYESPFKISWYADLRNAGHDCVWLPYDSGFGAKSNEAVRQLDRKYMLIASDDFEFTQHTRAFVEQMVKVMEDDQTIGVVSGRVANREYEALLDISEDGTVVKETRGVRSQHTTKDGINYSLCDLTVNFSLIRNEVLRVVKWDDEVKIGGGEHGAFFIDVKRAGWKTAFVPGVTIREVNGPSDWQDSRYPSYRNRARRKERECLKKRGVKEYHCMGGFVEVVI